MPNNDDRNFTRRSLLRATGGAAGTGLGLAAAVGSSQAGCHTDLPCPTCDEGKGGPDRFLIAHRPPGNPEKCIELCLPEPAAESHLEEHEHDTCGPCPDGDHGKGKKKGKKKRNKGKKKRKKKWK